jgi:hypothetical protein
MSDPTRADAADTTDPAPSDPDDSSTWSTIDNTAGIEDLMNEDDLENFLVEPIPDPFAPIDDSGNQGPPD